MTKLAERLDAARAEVARLEQEARVATCAEYGKHRWKSMGGRNAGCDPDCCCSVQVNECEVCGACDYGKNADAAATIARCEYAAALSLEQGETAP